ncbi:MAG: helix-turn-helix domain-containing protein [Deinococcus sp.]
MSPAPKGWEKARSLSLTEAAQVLRCSRSTAYVMAMAEDGRLPTTRDHLGDHRVKPAALKRLLREREGHQRQLPLRGLGR